MKGDEEIKAVCTCVLPYQILSVGELSGKAFTRTQLQAAFFRLYFHASVLRTTAGAASGAARKKTATRYDLGLGGSSRIIRAAGRIIKPRVYGVNP